jgi:hypothetical protein
MEPKEMLSKLDLIEEQARLTLEGLPYHLARERQNMIIALVKQMRWGLADTAQQPEAKLGSSS